MILLDWLKPKPTYSEIMNNFDLTMHIATIISRGRNDDISNVQIASEIMEYLEDKYTKISNKPIRDIGAVTQADLFRGQ